MTDNAAPTGIILNASHLPLARFLYSAKITIEVDGVPNTARWGRGFVSTAPGRHEVSVSFRYLFYKRLGLASIVVDVPAGRVVTLSFKAPWLITMAGKLRQER